MSDIEMVKVIEFLSSEIVRELKLLNCKILELWNSKIRKFKDSKIRKYRNFMIWQFDDLKVL